MKNLLNISLIIWLAPLIGKQQFPEVFGAWYVQWPSIVILFLLLPVGFANSLFEYQHSSSRSTKTLIIPISFMLIFSAVLLMQLPAYYVSSTLPSLERGPVVEKKDILAALSTAETEAKRKAAAQIIFNEYGNKVPYKQESGKYILYEPTISDISSSEISKQQKESIAFYKKAIIENAFQTIYLQAFELISFALLFAITLFVKQRSTNASKGQG